MVSFSDARASSRPCIPIRSVGEAPLEASGGREEVGLVVSPGDLAPVRDQTPHLATIGANSSASSAAPVLRALAQLSETMIMLAGEGEMGHARAVHEAIGRLLTSSSDSPEAPPANVVPPQYSERVRIGERSKLTSDNDPLTAFASSGAITMSRNRFPNR